jgi:hypothetical protein
MVKIYKFCECTLIDKQISSFIDLKKTPKTARLYDEFKTYKIKWSF